MKAEHLIVKPIDKEALIKHIESIVNPDENTSYITETVALVGNQVITDTECVYSIIQQRLYYGKIQPVYEVPVRVVTHTIEGRSIPMYTSFYFDVSIEEVNSKFTKPAVSLREFMGQRYEYNPRISKNTREFLSNFKNQ